MLNSFHKLVKLSIIFSAVIISWTSIVLLSSTTFNFEINELITKMYLSQKNFIFDIKELSLLLVKDANVRFSEKNQGIIRLKNAKTNL